MELKTNYKDDIYEGNRKYKEITNSDGTISLEDKTTYTQEATDRPDISCVDDLTSKASKKARRKEWGKVDRIVTGTDQITAYCNFEKPALDLPLEIQRA